VRHKVSKRRGNRDKWLPERNRCLGHEIQEGRGGAPPQNTEWKETDPINTGTGKRVHRDRKRGNLARVGPGAQMVFSAGENVFSENSIKGGTGLAAGQVS